MKKLQILQKPIDTKLISTHCFGMGEVSLDGFLHKLLDNQNINRDIYNLLEEGVNEIFIITQITSFVQQLFMINSYTRTHGYPNAKEILGYSPPKDVWDKKCAIASKIRPETYLRILDFYSELEFELKSNKHIEQNSYISSKLREHSVLFSI